jgi:hypothetical protein
VVWPKGGVNERLLFGLAYKRRRTYTTSLWVAKVRKPM